MNGMIRELNKLHPIILFTYFLVVIICGMIIINPIFQLISVLASEILLSMLRHKINIKEAFGKTAILIILSFVNTIFNSNGNTILLCVNSHKITLESMVYGLTLGMICITSINWFSCWNILITKDKFTYIFGRTLPKISMILIMGLKFVPTYGNKLKAITQAQESLAQENKNIKKYAQILLCLISSSLENTIITADSMKSRGYELNNKTIFSIYYFKIKETVMMCIILFNLILFIISSAYGGTQINILPRISLAAKYNVLMWSVLSYMILMLLPIIYYINKKRHIMKVYKI